MKCPKCEFENREGIKFCEKCGNKLELTCLKCGAKISLDRFFCGECGQDLYGDSAITQPRPAIPTVEMTSFTNERYPIKEKLGEGGKKERLPGI